MLPMINFGDDFINPSANNDHRNNRYTDGKNNEESLPANHGLPDRVEVECMLPPKHRWSVHLILQEEQCHYNSTDV